MKRSITHCINAATADTNSGWLPIAGAVKVSFFFTRSVHTSGNTVFSIDVAPEKDGTGGADYAKLVTNVTNTNAQNLTRVASVTLSSATTSYVSMSPEDVGGYVRVTADVTTDGTNDVWMIVCRD